MKNNDILIAIDEILQHLEKQLNDSEKRKISTNTLKLVDKFTKGFDNTKALWYKDKRKTLAMIVLFSLVLLIPGGIALSPVIVGIKDSIANGTKPIDAILEAYKKLHLTLKDNTKKTLMAIANHMQEIIAMKECHTKEEYRQQQQMLYDICKTAKNEIV